MGETKNEKNTHCDLLWCKSKQCAFCSSTLVIRPSKVFCVPLCDFLICNHITSGADKWRWISWYYFTWQNDFGPSYFYQMPTRLFVISTTLAAVSLCFTTTGLRILLLAVTCLRGCLAGTGLRSCVAEWGLISCVAANRPEILRGWVGAVWRAPQLRCFRGNDPLYLQFWKWVLWRRPRLLRHRSAHRIDG